MRVEIAETDPILAGLGDRQRFLLEHPELFLAYYFAEPNNERLEPFHLRLIVPVTTLSRTLIEYPAFHGKTTSLWRLAIWWICRNPNVRIGYVAKNEREAAQIGSTLQAELAENDRLVADFGPFRPEDDDTKPWSLMRLSVARRTLRAKEPTITLFGSGSKATLGHRTDITICDDVVTNDNSNTIENREKLRQWFNQNVQTMGRYPDSPLHVVGTRFHPEDLYGDLEELRDPESGQTIWPVFKEDAIVDEEKHLTLWPDRWPWAALQRLRAQMGTLDFNKRLRNKAVDPSRALFKEAYVKGGFLGKERYPGCLDESYRVGEIRDPSWQVFGGFDPAVGKTSNAKFCAHVTLAVGSCPEHERCYWVVDLRRDQMTLEQQIDCVIHQHERYGLLASFVETNAYQAVLEQAIDARIEELGKAYHIQGLTTSRHNKNSPEIGVLRLPPYFENGQVHIPLGNQESRRKMRQLIDELVEYPGRTTDCVMAFWMAWFASEQAAPALPSFNRLKRQAPFWHKQIGRRERVNPAYDREVASADHA